MYYKTLIVMEVLVMLLAIGMNLGWMNLHGTLIGLTI